MFCLAHVVLYFIKKNFHERCRKEKFIFRRFLIVLCCLVIGVICTIGEYEEKITQKFIYVVSEEKKNVEERISIGVVFD